LSLAGRAEILAGLGRRVDAADALDRLAGVLEDLGRLPEACDAARRALELAESRTRRRHLEAVTRRLRERTDDEAAAAAVDRAEAVLRRGESGPPDVPPAPPPDPTALAAEAEALLDAGDTAQARDRLLAAAQAYRRDARPNAALDACYLALAVAPDDRELHLALAEIYLELGWRGQAADKLVLLARLIELESDDAARARMCEIVREHLADDARLASICA
jgi:tetratricopeptide (TPR) repeat protein